MISKEGTRELTVPLQEHSATALGSLLQERWLLASTKLSKLDTDTS
jgi:hypothetical protein